MQELVHIMNLKQAAYYLGISENTLKRRIHAKQIKAYKDGGYWKSRKNEPRMGKVQMISDILGIGIDELLFGEPPVTDNNLGNISGHVSDIKKRGIQAVLSLPDEELELMVQLMERTLKDK